MIRFMRPRAARLRHHIALLLAVAGVLCAVLPARADQIVQTPQAPVVVVHSTSGLVTIARGDDGVVRVAGSSSATATTFQTGSGQGMLLPRGFGFPSRRFSLPGVQEGTLGVRIENPSGDATVYVPQRVAAVLVRLDGGDASLSDFRGPYVVVTNGGSVDLHSLFGYGHVRTTTGRVTLANVGGNLRIETTSGSVLGTGMLTERADVKTEGGDIDWAFGRLAGGPYRFTSGAGNVRVGLDQTQAANIDAQSTFGSVISRFGRPGDVRFRSPHAMSLNLRGGGPEITAASQSGIVEVGPRPH